MSVTLDGDGSGEARDSDGAVELRERCLHGALNPEAGSEEDGGEQEDQDGEEDGEDFGEDGGSCDL